MACSKRKLCSAHPLFSRKPFWKEESRLLRSDQDERRAVNTENTFPVVLRRETGLQFEMSEGSPDLGIKTTLAFFHDDGIVERSRTLLKKAARRWAQRSLAFKVEYWIPPGVEFLSPLSLSQTSSGSKRASSRWSATD
ncbi:hypothetical protein NPIL_462511 [Nephila pilipes]|uniref:Uncharacterized protein n=1 Tax=Nephila pilipes TaxID=299642 RepID=A0A8X6MEM5_NEPPI|nr:hypothetical protein NPIL_462511 [Nephila pilipes]